MLGLEEQSETAEYSEESEHFGDIEGFRCRFDKNAYSTQYVHTSIEHIPPVRK